MSVSDDQIAYPIRVLLKPDFCGDLVDWADLVTLDLSTFDAPGGKEKLASQLSEAVNRIGQLSPWHLSSIPDQHHSSAQ